MSDDLPIYSDSIFRNENPYPALTGVTDPERERLLDRFDGLDHGEGASNARSALTSIEGSGKEDIIGVHRTLFAPRDGAGVLRSRPVAAAFPGQDCPDPQFIGQSLNNLERWLSVDSLGELHPIQQAALALTRVVDIWPFDYGNKSVAVVFANSFLLRRDVPPFFVPASLGDEFDAVLADAIRMQTDSLCRAIYKCIERELDSVRE